MIPIFEEGWTPIVREVGTNGKPTPIVRYDAGFQICSKQKSNCSNSLNISTAPVPILPSSL